MSRRDAAGSAAPGAASQVRSLWGDWDVHTPRARRRPRVQVEVGRWVPAWLVRLVAAVLVALAGAVLATGVAQLVAALILALGVALSGSGSVPAATVALMLVALVTRLPEAPSLLGVAGPALTAVLLLCLHAMVYLSRRVTDVGPRAQVELAALAAGLPAAVAIQAFAQLLALLTAAAGDSGVDLTWLALAAVAALVALAWLGLRALRGHGLG